jgi:mannose PTS system EIID component
MSSEGVKLPRFVLARILVRSFLLQGSWNFERLQSLGVVFVLAPALRFIFRGEDLQMAYSRHLEYFNTHPFLASSVIGTILALEEKGSRGEDGPLSVQEFKRMTMAPYAAMGDALFWGGLRPMAAGVSLFFAAKGSLWAPVVFLVLFNLPHLWFRLAGLLQGYFFGLGIVEIMQNRHLPDMAIRIKEGTVILLGGLGAYLTFLQLRGEGLFIGWGLSVVPAVAVLGWLARKGFSSLLLVMTTSALLLAFSQLTN